jgi:rhomboid protease GluP
VPPAFDANHLFFWLVVVVTAVDLLRSLALQNASIRGIRASLALVLTIAVLGRLLDPDRAGAIALCAWCVLALAPGLIARAATQQAHRGRFARAHRLAKVLRFVRPFERWSDLSDYYQALELERAGRHPEAEALLDKLQAGGGPFASSALLERFTARGDWRGLRAYIEQERSRNNRDPILAPTWLRALGETGNPAGLLEAAEQLGGELRSAAHARLLDHCRLFTFAFAGRPGRVAELLAGPLRHLDPVTAEVWRATAELASGQVVQGRDRLERCLSAADGRARRVVLRRLDLPPPVVDGVFDDTDRARLARLEKEWEWARRYSPALAEPRALWTTWTLSALLGASFLVEVATGSSMDPDTLLRLGALDSSRALAGEWWRVLTAQFLHFGPLHLLPNVGALLLLGGFVERRLGPLRYLLVYFAAGSLALSGFVVLVALELRPADVLLGASANVMGIVGATAAILVHGLWTDRARVAARPLITVLLIVAGQAVIDLLVPNLSFIGHALGAVCGFVVTGLMLRLRVRLLIGVFVGGVALSSLLESWNANRAPRDEPAEPRDSRTRP